MRLNMNEKEHIKRVLNSNNSEGNAILLIDNYIKSQPKEPYIDMLGFGITSKGRISTGVTHQKNGSTEFYKIKNRLMYQTNIYEDGLTYSEYVVFIYLKNCQNS